MAAGSKWYFSLWVLVIAIILLGPFALPLVWLNPGLKKDIKIAISAIIAVMTAYMLYASIEIVKAILKEAGELQRVLK